MLHTCWPGSLETSTSEAQETQAFSAGSDFQGDTYSTLLAITLTITTIINILLISSVSDLFR